MNVSQALEYERQPFIPMFIYGDHGAMESERQKGEEALKVLETEYFTAEGDPSFDFATVRDLADRNRDLCDQIGEARLRNVTPATLSRGLSDADTCAAIGKMQKRTAASVMREIRGDRDALGVAYARKPIQGTVLGIDIETTGRAPERGYIINVGWEIMELTSDAVRTTPRHTTAACPTSTAARMYRCRISTTSPGTTSTAKRPSARTRSCKSSCSSL